MVSSAGVDSAAAACEKRVRAPPWYDGQLVARLLHLLGRGLDGVHVGALERLLRLGDGLLGGPDFVEVRALSPLYLE